MILRIKILCAFGVIAFLGAAISAAADPPSIKTLEIGQSAPDFELPGVDGKTYRLDDFKAAKILVIIFTCNHCPTAQAYEDRIIELHKDYKDRGVALVAISPNDPKAVRLDELGYSDLGDSLDEMKIRAKDKGFTYPYLFDGRTQITSAAYGVLATPHVFIFNNRRKLCYVGRVDNSDIGEVTSHDARNAIDALLAEKPILNQTTRVFGCSTKWSNKRENAAEALKTWDAEPVELETIDPEAVKSIAENKTNKLRLINLWATYCGPCVEELPELVAMNRMYRKRDFEMITISLDDVAEKPRALDFLNQRHVSAKNYIFNSTDRDKLAEALDPKWPGPMPYTVLIAPGGEVIYRQHGPLEPLEVKKAIVNYLGRTYAIRKK
ncbi:MAG: redoxin family protein [Thermoguttaceae bacterium]